MDQTKKQVPNATKNTPSIENAISRHSQKSPDVSSIPEKAIEPTKIEPAPGTEKNDPKETDHFEHVDDSKVVAPITIAPDGGWGWVVVAASFWHVYCVEGIGFSFGPMKAWIMDDLHKSIASVAIINSMTIGFMCLFGPVSSALINRFGFRLTSMTGSVLSAFGAFMASIGGSYAMLLIFYGAIMGIGFSLTMSSSSLIVGFYFKKKRALATALCLCGNSIGISSNSIIIFYLNRRGWQSTIMLQAAMIGSMFFTSMVFRPLLSITVQHSSDQKHKKSHFSPYLHSKSEKNRRGSINSQYKRAVDLIDEQAQPPSELLMESAPKRKPSRIVSKVDLRRISKSFSEVKAVRGLEQKTDKLLITIHNEESEKHEGCFGKLFSWRPHVKEARPLYRDDAFHEGNVKKTETKGSTTKVGEKPSGIDYHLAMSRVTTAKDMKEKKTITSTAVKRVLVSMADPRLIRTKSFLIFLFAVFFSYLGLVIPYVYVIDRSRSFDVPKRHYQWFVSVIALSGLAGRIIIGIIATKVPATFCAQLSAWMVGISSLISNFFTTYHLQYLYCIVFGFFMSGIVICRFLIIVDVYGLELLTNGAGLCMLTQGLAFLLTLPAAGLILSNFGVNFSFVYSSICCFCGAICFLLVPIVRRRELYN